MTARSDLTRWLYVFDGGPIDCCLRWGPPGVDVPPVTVLHMQVAANRIDPELPPVTYDRCCAGCGVAHFVEHGELERRCNEQTKVQTSNI